jgi:hypothetical protein
MRDPLRFSLTAVLALALLAASCSAPPPPGAIALTPQAEAALVAGDAVAEDAQRAFEHGRWDDAIALYAQALAAYGEGGDAVLGGSRDQALYNSACAHARAGRAREAAETFAKSVASGVRPVVVQYPTGGWVEARGLTLEHLLADADLDTIRNEPAYLSAIEPLLSAGDVTVECAEPVAGARVPAVIVLAPEGDDGSRARAAWRAAAKAPIALVVLEGPVRPTPKDRRWILGDGDERWAVAKVREALALLLHDARVDTARVFVAGVGEHPGEAAWAAALAEPAGFAGFAAPGGRFHAAWHADAIAAAPASWRVALGRDDALPAKMLKDRGIAVARLAPELELSKTAQAALEAMLGGP